MRNKIAGMLELGAYGDALGAACKGKSPPAALVERLPRTLDFHEGAAHPWGIWLPASAIPEDCRGMVTADTAFVVFILGPFVDWRLRNRLPAAEREFALFLEELRNATTPVDRRDASPIRFIEAARNRQIDDWLEMYGAAVACDDPTAPSAERVPEGVRRGFSFEGSTPVCFGLFLGLPLACAFRNASREETFRFFHGLTRLDRGHAKSVTGILGSLVAEAFRESDVEARTFPVWYRKNLDRLLDPGFHRNLGTDLAALERIVETRDRLVRLVRDLANWPDSEVIAALHHARAESLPNGVRGLESDPAEFLGVVSAAVHFGGEDPHTAMKLIVNSGGNAATIATAYGRLAGAYFGKEGVRERSGPEMLEDLDRLDRTLRTVLEVDPRDVESVFFRYSQVGPTPPARG